VEVRDPGILGREQSEHQIDRQGIRRREIDRFFQTKKRRDRTFETRHTRMRKCDAPAEAGAAERFALFKPFEHILGVELVNGRETLGQLDQYFVLRFSPDHTHGLWDKGKQ
jgi:hypothetical protein